MNTTAKTIAETGICNFLCWRCEINKECEEYNHRGNDDIALDQKEVRARFARESIMRSGG